MEDRKDSICTCEDNLPADTIKARMKKMIKMPADKAKDDIQIAMDMFLHGKCPKISDLQESDLAPPTLLSSGKAPVGIFDDEETEDDKEVAPLKKRKAQGGETMPLKRGRGTSKPTSVLEAEKRRSVFLDVADDVEGSVKLPKPSRRQWLSAEPLRNSRANLLLLPHPRPPPAFPPTPKPRNFRLGMTLSLLV